jgi:hypothetical protein
VLEASGDLDDDAVGGSSCRFASPRISGNHPSSDRERRFLVQVPYLQHVAGRWSLRPRRLRETRRLAQGEIQTLAWDVEADWEYPWPIPKGSVHICASGGGHFACSPVVLEDTTGSAPPPYTYHFESITSGFEVRCPGRLQLSLEWNPGLGFLPIVQLDLRCNGC